MCPSLSVLFSCLPSQWAMLLSLALLTAAATLVSAQQDCPPFPSSQVPANAYMYDCESISINATCVLACVSDIFMPQGDPTFVCTETGWLDNGTFSCISTMNIYRSKCSMLIYPQ